MSEATRLERASLAVPGVRSELRLDAGHITVSRHVTTQARPTEVSFPVEAVRGATLRRPQGGERGWLHVAAVGGTPAPVGELAASSDPYTLPLGSRHTRRARKLARMVERHIQERGLPADHTTSSSGGTGAVAPAVTIGRGPLPEPRPEVAPSDDGAGGLGGVELVDHLRQLAALRDQGALSDAEFQRAKDRVLRGAGDAAS